MSSSSDANIVASLNNASALINRYLGAFVFFFGTIGNALNIVVLSRKKLRSNSCSWLFLLSSIASIVACSFGLTTRILSGWNIDPSRTDRVLCKLRGFFVFVSLTISAWLIALATIDRWLSSSTIALRRQKSTLKNAQRGTIIIVCLSIAVYIEVLICYDTNAVNALLQCYSLLTGCRLLSDLSFAIITIVFPLLVMAVFGLMTVFHLREAHRRVHQMDSNIADGHGRETRSTNMIRSQHHRKKLDRQLLIMLLFHVVLLIILSLPIATIRLYLTITASQPVPASQIAIGNFAYNLAIIIYYSSNGISFYVNILIGSSIFRKELLGVVQMFRRIILCQ